jgi:polyhydroxyalkanoate synthase subunit PhaC
MDLARTPKDVIHSEGTARLYRFRSVVAQKERRPILLVPSVINRWYVLDLRPGASVVEALVDRGFDVFCLDWGVPEDEDRFLGWDDLLKRLGRAVRVVARECRADEIGLLGYCMGGTLAGIFTALEPDRIAAFVNLAGPFDFKAGGFLAHMVDRRWFDAEAIAAAGNVSPWQMQSGFVALRPTAQVAKLVSLADKIGDRQQSEAFFALESWASDNVPFPAAAYATYIGELYQENALVRGEHWALGKKVELSRIACPVLTVATDRDTICPCPAASALNDAVSSTDRELFVIPGGHVGAVVGSKARVVLYPKLASWFGRRLGKPVELVS